MDLFLFSLLLLLVSLFFSFAFVICEIVIGVMLGGFYDDNE